jgi:hypothetical protein
MKICLVLAGALLSSTLMAELTAREQGGISDALRLANVSRSEAVLRRANATATPWLRTILNEPLTAFDSVTRLHAASTLPLDSALLNLLRETSGALTPPTKVAHPAIVLPKLTGEFRQCVLTMVDALQTANLRIRLATARLTPEQRRALIEGLPQRAAGDRRTPFSFVKRRLEDPRELIPLLQKIDQAQLRAAAVSYVSTMYRATLALRRASAGLDFPTPYREKIGWINVEITGRGNHRHTSTNSMLSIDLGGDDIYTGRYGAGVGYAAAVIDLSGNDRYEGGDASFGVGILGFGVAFDLAGRDTYDAGSVSFGVGLGGYGVLWDANGDDRYHGVALSQGFGAYGVGILRDDAGRDTYDAGLRAQGSSRTNGIGWLVDRAGDDIYRLGGALGANANAVTKQRGYGQGYGAGFDSANDQPGGIGLLTDLGGDDAYLGGVAVQASAEDGGLGSLFDRNGDDTYRGRAKAEGYATENAVAVLMDAEGDDSYSVLSGPGLGFSSRRSVSCLLDSAGDDLYAGREARPGVAQAESFALFVDAQGSDRYPGMPSAGSETGDFDSLSLFADLDGVDIYPEGLADSAARGRASRWSAFDRTSNALAVTSPSSWPEPGSVPSPGESKLGEIYRNALESGDARPLVAIGEPALEFCLRNRLRDLGTPNAWVAETVAGILPGPAVNLLRQGSLSKESLQLIGNARLTDGVDLVIQGLGKEELQAAAADAAGRLNLLDTIPTLVGLTVPGDRPRVLAALTALSRLGSATAAPAGQPYLTTPDSGLRAAARAVVALDPVRALDIGKTGLQSSDVRNVRFMIELLGEVGSLRALALIEPYLSSSDSETKIAALLAYQSRFPSRLASVLDKLRNDPDPLVRSVAIGVDWQP